MHGASLGLPGEDIRPAAEVDRHRAPYLSTLLVPGQRPTRGGQAVTGATAATGKGQVRGRRAGRRRPAHPARAPRLIAAADVVVWASSLVQAEVLAHARADAEIVDSAALPLEDVRALYERALAGDLVVARIHSGDPALWGAVQEQLERCGDARPGDETSPGSAPTRRSPRWRSGS